MQAARLLDLTESTGVAIDRLIGLKFPAYLIPHPRKVLWLLHQHRPAYDLWDTPFDDMSSHAHAEAVRDGIREADRALAGEARAVYTISKNVSERLKRFCGVESTALYHPPNNAGFFYRDEALDYVFFPSRLSLIKRQNLVIEALAKTRHPVRVRFAGLPDDLGYYAELKKQAFVLGVEWRVEWLGGISEEEKIRQYAHALAVVFPPLDEDYGYVTLEAMLAAKPVITCADSGGVLEFVRHRETGLVCPATAQELAACLDEAWENRGQARAWGEQGRDLYHDLGVAWGGVVERLLE